MSEPYGARLFDAAPDAMLAMDAEGRIVLANAQAERLFGYSLEDLRDLPVETLVPDAAQELGAEPRGAPLEVAARRKDGTGFRAEITVSTVETGEGSLTSVAVRDVTERVHQAQRMESLGQIASGVAHDFNNLLSVIGNYASFVEEEINAAREADGSHRWDATHQDVQQIQRATERATALTRQLLAFGRRGGAGPQPLVLNTVVTDLEQLLRRSLGEHIDLVTSLEPELWEVSADPGQLEQLLVSLAMNARDAMPEGGSLRISTANDGVGPRRHVRLGVGNTPSGEAGVEATAGEAVGLRFATAYRIVAEAAGQAWLDTEPGLGTTFTALLPAVGEQASPPAGGEVILVVEDDEAMREVVRRVLSGGGYQVLTACGGPEALEVVGVHIARIHLLLTDVVMPGLLGPAVAARIRAVRPEIRVLYMSGYEPSLLGSRRGIPPGATVIGKPFSPAELLRTVRVALDGPAG